MEKCIIFAIVFNIVSAFASSTACGDDTDICDYYTFGGIGLIDVLYWKIYQNYNHLNNWTWQNKQNNQPYFILLYSIK